MIKKITMRNFLLILSLMMTFAVTAQTTSEKKKDAKKKPQPITERIGYDVVEVEETSEEITDVPFTIVEQVPIYPGCEEGDNTAKKKCFVERAKKHVTANFNANLPNQIGLSPGKKRLIALFRVDREGNIIDLRARAPHPRLVKEMIRVFKLLPKMTPGRQRGKPVSVMYTFPMRFTVDIPSKED